PHTPPLPYTTLFRSQDSQTGGSFSSITGKRLKIRNRTDYTRSIHIELEGGGPYLAPENTGSYDYALGVPINRWNGLYLSNQPNVSSDRKLKTDIESIDLDFATRSEEH